ncbi:MAG TPA: hypothetical protein VHA52_11895, partial [Candidatus Babeliaceae bacterium]|nr:hypothetical protein [Candidatus Babeliaceae bacterium]
KARSEYRQWHSLGADYKNAQIDQGNLSKLPEIVPCTLQDFMDAFPEKPGQEIFSIFSPVEEGPSLASCYQEYLKISEQLKTERDEKLHSMEQEIRKLSDEVHSLIEQIEEEERQLEEVSKKTTTLNSPKENEDKIAYWEEILVQQKETRREIKQRVENLKSLRQTADSAYERTAELETARKEIEHDLELNARQKELDRLRTQAFNISAEQLLTLRNPKDATMLGDAFAQAKALKDARIKLNTANEKLEAKEKKLIESERFQKDGDELVFNLKVFDLDKHRLVTYLQERDEKALGLLKLVENDVCFTYTELVKKFRENRKCQTQMAEREWRALKSFVPTDPQVVSLDYSSSLAHAFETFKKRKEEEKLANFVERRENNPKTLMTEEEVEALDGLPTFQAALKKYETLKLKAEPEAGQPSIVSFEGENLD